MQIGESVSNPNSIDREISYRIDEKLGDNNGFVYLCSMMNSKEIVKKVVIKEIPITIDTSETNFELLQTCAEAHNSHVLLVIEHFKLALDNNTIILVMEYCGMDLSKLRSELACVTPCLVLQVLVQNIVGLVALYKFSLLHNDIKPKNMFVLQFDKETSEIHLVIGDYGNLLNIESERIENDMPIVELEKSTQMGTFGYLAPEITTDEHFIYSIKSDIWSLGISILTFISNRSASNFTNYSNIEREIDSLFENLISNGEKSKYSDEWMEIKKVVSLTLKVDRNERQDYAELLKIIFSEYKGNDILKDIHSIQQEFRYLNPVFKKDKDITCLAVSKYGCNLIHALPEFRNDKKVVLKAITQNGMALKYASKELRSDRQTVIAAISNDGYSLHCASYELRDDINLAEIAVKSTNQVLHLCVTFRLAQSVEYRQLVEKKLSTVLFDGNMIGRESKFENQDDIFRLSNNPSLMKSLSLQQRNDKSLILQLVSINGMCLEFASEMLKFDEQVVLRAITSIHNSIRFAPYFLRNNIKFMKKAIDINVHCVMFAGDIVKSEESIILQVANKSHTALKHCNILHNYLNVDFLSELLSCSGESLQYCHINTKMDREMVKKAVTENGMAIRFAHESFRNNVEIMSIAVKQCGYALQYGSYEVRGNTTVIINALTTNIQSFQYINEKEKKNPNGAIKYGIDHQLLDNSLFVYNPFVPTWFHYNREHKHNVGDTLFPHEIDQYYTDLKTMTGLKEIDKEVADEMTKHPNVDFQFMERRANEGDPLALQYIGQIYGGEVLGWDCTPIKMVNYEKAFECYKKSAENQNKKANYPLSVNCYGQGIGTMVDIEKAMKIMEENLDDPDMAHFLARCHLHEIGKGISDNEFQTDFRNKVPLNVERGVELLKIASNNGSAGASGFLGFLYGTGRLGVRKNRELSREYTLLSKKQTRLFENTLGFAIPGLEMEIKAKSWLVFERSFFTYLSKWKCKTVLKRMEVMKLPEYKFAAVYRKLGNIDKSIELYEKQMELMELPFPEFMLGVLYFEKALSYLKKDSWYFVKMVIKGLPYIFSGLNLTQLDQFGITDEDQVIREMTEDFRRCSTENLSNISLIIFSGKFKISKSSIDEFIDRLEQLAQNQASADAYFLIGISCLKGFRYSKHDSSTFFYKSSLLGHALANTFVTNSLSVSEMENYFNNLKIDKKLQIPDFGKFDPGPLEDDNPQFKTSRSDDCNTQ